MLVGSVTFQLVSARQSLKKSWVTQIVCIQVYVATRNDALASVIAKCPPQRKSDLVFYGQNGYIEDFLKEQVRVSALSYRTAKQQ